MREFDIDTIGVINAFENMTKTEVRDCVIDDTVFFLVNEGKVGIAIGKKGKVIKSAERIIKRPIKIFEWADEDKAFIKNMIPQAQKIEIKNNNASVTIGSKDRGAVIGKNGNNIKVIRELLERNSDIKDLKVL
jgi:N utilization substance protein A